MTRRKESGQSPTPLQLRQYRLRKIAMCLGKDGQLAPAEKKFLVRALMDIGMGVDANLALEVKAKRGERKQPSNTAKIENPRFALAFIATLVAPESEGGFGMPLAEAIAETAEEFRDQASFGYTDETLTHYWNHYPEWRTRSFSRPIETLPDDRAKDGD